MVTAASYLNSSAGRHYQLILEVTESEINSGNNTSRITAKAYIKTDGYGSASGANRTATIKIGSNSHNVTHSVNVGSNSTLTIGSASDVMVHDGNGNLTVNVSVSAGLWGVAGTGTTSLSFKCRNIARKSTSSPLTVTIGSAATINVTRQGSNTHTVQAIFGSYTNTIADKSTGDSFTFTPPTNWATVVPNSTSGKAVLRITTYAGSTNIGSNDYAMTVNLPGSFAPSISSVTVNETVQKVKDVTKESFYLQNLSNPKVTVNASGNNGSTIASYSISIKNNGGHYTNANGGTLGVLSVSGSVTIVATVTDSRKRTATKETTITVQPYTPPSLGFSITRNGTNLVVSRNISVSSIKSTSNTELNSMTVTSAYREHGTSAWTNISGAPNISKTSAALSVTTNSNVTGSFAEDKSWDIRLTVTDLFNPISVVQSIGTSLMPIAIGTDRFGIGGLPSGANMTYSKYPYYYNDKEIQNHKLTNANGTSLFYGSKTLDLNTLLSNIFVSTNEPANGPLGQNIGQFLVSVYAESDNYLVQQAVEKKNGRMYTRARHGGTWYNWVEYELVENPSWVNIGNSFSYKKYKQMVSLKYNFNTNGVESFEVGSMPSELVPENMMFVIAAQTKNTGFEINLNVNTNGTVVWFNPKKENNKFNGQVTWFI